MHLFRLAALVLAAACTPMQNDTVPPLRSRPFGTGADGRAATLWTLHAHGLEADVTDFGAALVAMRVPDRRGSHADVVLGFDDVAGYQSADNQYFGCTTGRVCNRIAKGTFVLDGKKYQLATNNGPNHLHGGGARSFDKVWWRGEAIDGADPAVRFTYRSADGEEGYPGNLDVAVTYTLVNEPAPGLRITFEATTDARTPVNLTNHAYWNLAGAGAPTVLDHVLHVTASQYTPTDDTLIPTGELAAVAGTPLDFRQPQALGARIKALDASAALGYDHNFALDGGGSGTAPAATLLHAASGRRLEIRTTEPGLQVYSGNFLKGQRGKSGHTYAQRSAVCLETQHYPDSVNHPHFPGTILAPGKAFRSETVFTFTAQ